MTSIAEPPGQTTLFEPATTERYRLVDDGRVAVREVLVGNECIESTIPVDSGLTAGQNPHDVFDASWLRATSRPETTGERGDLRLVDLFSGCGAMSLGVEEAARAVGKKLCPVMAVDTNERAISVYRHNFPGAHALLTSVTDLLDGELGGSITSAERNLKAKVGSVDLVIGGPPCQGNSDLNNHTRRHDPKNRLFLTMARFAEVVQPRHVMIENVPGVVHDRQQVVEETSDRLCRLGYHVWTGVLHAARFGVAQRRRRFFLAASLDQPASPGFLDRLAVPERALEWAIDDLIDRSPGTNVTFDTSANHSLRNQERIRFLFEHELYELPNEERPDCHRNKRHSYNSVYGRMFWGEPTQTITTGFACTGKGRNVHPLRPRTLTPHEAARVQFIPDFFTFPEDRRVALQDLIGNAVPPKLSYVMALSLLAR